MINVLIINLGSKLSLFKKLVNKDYFIVEIKKKKINLKNIDGLFISNGPGYPQKFLKYKNIILYFLYYKIPILSICLGHQIISIINKFEILKLKIGHHGCNHTLYNKYKNKIYITLQNHNFNIKKKNKKNLINNYKSLIDKTLQNIMSLIFPLLSFQNHPEGSSGPNDLIKIFEFYNINNE
ncbi:glutamine amidotransferase-related protein [Candidatus Carsonella ruddii]|uniref:carbamoyl-phosphate synthase (glutamine-hydrolyzing) n=1 Tax=Candidatus Carsonella ruddii PC isolate NHV TaxID=1202540 RepID=J3YQP4_CARRU|nr:truncated carbamoylphosphate synthase small subunit [Candidatus Carsonella ruddii]AFP84293.1 truncated carbamoylphosphate synthase small subunit [Candidatus Carsonella ruddii PC isolate NHV]